MPKPLYAPLLLMMTVSTPVLSQPAGSGVPAQPSAPPANEAATSPSPAAPSPVPATSATLPSPAPERQGSPVASGTPAPAKPAANAAAPYEGPPLLLGHKKPHVGGYGGLTVAYSHMLHRDGVLVGGGGAMLLDHRLSLGGAGYGFTRTPSGPPRADGTPREYVTGYGGFVIRYAAYTDFPVYASLGFLIGGGAIQLVTDHEADDDWDDDEVKSRGYFVTQPDLTLHVNPTRWLRFGVMLGYRIATAVDDFDYDAGDVGGVVAGGNIEFGWF